MNSKKQSKTQGQGSIDDRISEVQDLIRLEKQANLVREIAENSRMSYNSLFTDAGYERHFVTMDNKRLRHLFDLAAALESMEDIIFKQHVNQFKNDFSRWVKDVFHHEELSYRMSKAGTRHEMKRIVAEEVGKSLRH